jgi:hypothetical protein
MFLEYFRGNESSSKSEKICTFIERPMSTNLVIALLQFALRFHEIPKQNFVCDNVMRIDSYANYASHKSSDLQ